MDSSEAVRKIQADQEAPVTERRKELEPIRGLMEEGQRAHERVVAQVMPVIEDAQRKQAEASRVGIRLPALNDLLARVQGDILVGGLAHGGLENYRDVIRRIDQLSADDLYQRRDVTIPSAAKNSLQVTSDLVRFAEEIRKRTVELAALLIERATGGAPASGSISTSAEAPKSGKIKVESDFPV